MWSFGDSVLLSSETGTRDLGVTHGSFLCWKTALWPTHCWPLLTPNLLREGQHPPSWPGATGPLIIFFLFTCTVNQQDSWEMGQLEPNRGREYSHNVMSLSTWEALSDTAVHSWSPGGEGKTASVHHGMEGVKCLGTETQN